MDKLQLGQRILDILSTANDNFTELENTKVSTSDLSDVALTGEYSDLTGQPTKLSQFENDEGFVTEAEIGLEDVMEYKGDVDVYSNLPTTGNKKGDVYRVINPEISWYIWSGTAWLSLGGSGSVDLANYYTKIEVDTKLSTKVDKEEGSRLITADEINKLQNIEDNATKVESSTTNGNILVDDEEVQVYRLPIGNITIGGVKNGGNVLIDGDGSMNAPDNRPEATTFAANDVRWTDLINGYFHLVIPKGEALTAFNPQRLVNGSYVSAFLDITEDSDNFILVSLDKFDGKVYTM